MVLEVILYMKKYLAINFIMAISLLATSSKTYAYDDLSESITVLAPTSFTDVMTKLVRIYSLNSNSTVSATFDSPSRLIKIVESGKQADIVITEYRIRNYISEKPTRMDDLQNQGLIEIESKVNIAQANIVLVASKYNPLSKKYLNGNFSEILDSLDENIKLIIPDYEKEPSGMYIKEALITSGNWKSFENRIIKAYSNRDATYKISKTAGIGFVYNSDVFNDDELVIISNIPSQVIISSKPLKYHEKIIFQAAVVAGKQMVKAREFLEFLQSKEVKQIFRKYKFKTVK